MRKFDVLVIGGGYAGVMCALRLAPQMRRRNLSIGLVNPRAYFVERLRLHEGLVAAGAEAKHSFDFRTFLGSRRIDFIQAEVQRLERGTRTVFVTSSSGEDLEIAYERLVIAAGTRIKTTIIPGAAEHGYIMETGVARGAEAARAALAQMEAPRVLVVGAGATGVEVAVEIAGRDDAEVTLIEPGRFGRFTIPAIAERLRFELERAGVRLCEGVRVERIDENRAETSLGTLDFDMCIICSGFVTPDFVGESELATATSGRLSVDVSLQSTSDERIFAAGDCALPVESYGAPPRMSVFYALCTGAHAAQSVARSLAGKPGKPFGFWTYGQAFGLGQRAIGFSSFPNDRPLRPYFRGRTAFHLRRFFVWLLFQILKTERVMPGLPFYLRPRARRRQLRMKAAE